MINFRLESVPAENRNRNILNISLEPYLYNRLLIVIKFKLYVSSSSAHGMLTVIDFRTVFTLNVL